jgi:Periplasmic protein TonB, links inner and outer membranes
MKSIINGALAAISGLLLNNNLFAQEDITYWKNTGVRVDHRDSADYIRVIVPPGAGRELPHLVEYFPNEQVKKVGVILDGRNTRSFQGPVVEYYEDGQKRSEEFFDEGKRVGEGRYYYQNGRLKKLMRYGKGSSVPAMGPTDAAADTLVNYFDSLGNVLVTAGNGFVRETDDEDYEEGHYRNGLRDGEWTGSFMKGKYTFSERYENGVVVSGVSRDTAGHSYPYENRGTPPEYPGGIRGLMQFVAGNYRYPPAALAAGVNGMLIFGFVVERDGSIAEIKVTQDLGYGTGAAGVQVLKRARKWKPGYQRGVPVRVSYMLPVRLNAP